MSAAYRRQAGRAPLLSAEEEQELGRRGDRAARDTLILANLRLVAWLVGRHRTRGHDKDDLIGVGNLALVKAAETWEPAPTRRFAFYARLCIRNALLNATSARPRSTEPLVDDPAAPLADEPPAEPRELARMRDSLRTLPRREADVIRLRFGLDGGDPMLLRQVAVALGVSKERARQIESRALERLRCRMSAA